MFGRKVNIKNAELYIERNSTSPYCLQSTIYTTPSKLRGKFNVTHNRKDTVYVGER